MRCDSSACKQRTANNRALFLEDGWMKPGYVTVLRRRSVTPCESLERRRSNQRRHPPFHFCLSPRDAVDRPWPGASVAQLCPALVAEPAIFILFTPSATWSIHRIISYPAGNVHSQPEILVLRGNATRPWQAHRRGEPLIRTLCSLLCIDASPQQLACCWPCHTSKRFFWAAGTPVRFQFSFLAAWLSISNKARYELLQISGLGSLSAPWAFERY